MARNLRVVFVPGVIEEIMAGPDAYRFMERIGDEIADDARGRAPRQAASHGGAASIGASPKMIDGMWAATIGWDRVHFYMYFPEKGTKYQPARPFMVPALDRYAAMGI